ncbi:hypothetical protein ND861_01295 [Leptospira sp. 2 VSF19]|uniref:Alginate export domain-containing protein n=1 Tax=Leptospira soteropolitanensis TaxID=2950025 RepID=A0AAW5VGX6_9LEPT|nr:hypothetical protein [Leptospira soteropolitanensis]MCW7491280.1 hypothetical protein [Leptospira soteropolitanensis]MCW7498865.1 hypothetical protein [Leptospira soteropolitanensis]MCW7521543.1 hypothetical protein [Leptospira soteropolitanensis]MCW7524968.1 hypothetical protein [Leptospira soteropolitanensis]MCW7528836.1 hypothetical protein [Leptospira soteropolitanensis]
MDDERANRSFGRVVVKDRFQTIPSGTDIKGFGLQTELITGGRFQSQKGGLVLEKANRYYGYGVLTTPSLFYYAGEGWNFGILIAPRVGISEERIIDKEVRTIYDSEFTALVSKEISGIQLALEVGRGFNRLDRYGFFFVGMSNFGSASVSFTSGIRITGIQLNAKPELENWFGPPWSGYRREIYGGLISSEKILIWEELRFFHYLYSDPNHNTNGQILSGQRVSGRYSYSGMEFQFKKFLDTWALDLVGIRLLGESKSSTNPWSEKQIATNSYLGFLSLHSQGEKFSFSLAGLVTKKDQKDRLDSNSNGYASNFAEPRVLGGFSSFLLYQTLDSINPPQFRDVPTKENPNFENKGNRIYGIQMGWDWYSFFRTDLFLNRSDSGLGKGNEVIGKLSFLSNDYGKLFAQMSASYTLMDPRKTHVFITEPFTLEEPKKEYLRFYVSLGMKF